MRDAYTTALRLLAARELSEAQLRTRLLRRHCDAEDVERTVERLKGDGSLDDRRVARAAARLEVSIRQRGRGRVLQRVRQIGIDAETAAQAVNEVFGEVDEKALLDRAIARRLKGASPAALDRRATARIVRALVGQGFQAGAVLRWLRAKGGRAEVDGE